MNTPVDELRTRLGELPRGRPLHVYCQVGQRGYLAVRILRQAGFQAANLAGGFATYRMFGDETVNETLPHPSDRSTQKAAKV